MRRLEERLLTTMRMFYDDVATIVERFKNMNAFELLISTIISQNTSWKNVTRAMANLKEKGLLSIDGILRAEVGELEQALKVAGLYRVKAAKIKEIAKRLSCQGLNLDSILSLSYSDARAKLMELPAVGRKTADVLLAFKAGAPVIPIDTHISRVSKLLGLVNDDADYEEIRARLEAFVPQAERALFHLALIKFGREVCKAKRPQCHVCPLNDVCVYRASRL